jgi:hypothetical protein
MRIYCQKCGNGTEYSFDKPKFCSGCGSSFSIAPSVAAKVTRPTPKITQVDEEEEISTERVPDISKLDFDIDIRSNKGSKLNSLMGTHNGQSSEEPISRSQGLNKAEALESFKREAGFYPARQSMNEEE